MSDEAGRNEEVDIPLRGAGSDQAAAMRLHGPAPRVTRLSRKVLAGLGAVALIGIGGALIYALQTRDDASAPEELYSTDNRSTADGLRSLPRDYSAVPQLGPPLPGDLGRPMLNNGNRVPTGPVPTPAPDPVEQRRLQEMEAARISALFADTQTDTTSDTAATDASPPTSPSLAELGLAPDATTPATQDRQLAFLNASVDRRVVSPDRVMAPASPYILQAGSVIPAALVTGIRSDLPGQIIAQVTEHVYDSRTGQFLLVPQGTRIIGEYDSGVSFGQRRVLLVWTRMMFPNGRSIVLERQPGADPQGYAGLEDSVDYHWWDIAKAAGLSTLLAVGAELATDDADRLVQAIQDGAQDTVNDAGQQIVRRQLSVAPTLTIRPGFPVRVIVTRDLVLEPYAG